MAVLSWGDGDGGGDDGSEGGGAGVGGDAMVVG